MAAHAPARNAPFAITAALIILGLALAVELERLEHLQQRRRGFGIAPGADGAAEKIERQDLGALQYLRRDVLESEIGDIACKRFGFMGHCVSPLLSHRVGGLISSFKRAVGDGQQLCARSFTFITGLACNIRERDPCSHSQNAC